jgi:hypothetical protein
MNTGLAGSSEWLSNWGTTTGCKTFLIYWSPAMFPCMVTRSNLQLWEIHPISLLIPDRKGQLAGYSFGYTPYFSVSKLSFVYRLHEAETGPCSTNGSYARSSNSNHVSLNNMLSVSLISIWYHGTFIYSPWLQSCWFQTVPHCSCWQTSIW